MRRRHVAVLVYAMCLAVWLSTTPTTTHAQPAPATQASLRVSPAIVEVGMNADSLSASSMVSVGNTSDRALNVSGVARPFTADGSIAPAEQSRYDTFNWVTVDPPSAVLAPNGSQDFVLNFSAPPGWTPGGHYATVSFSAGPAAGSSASSASASVEAGVGALVLATMAGDVREGMVPEGTLQAQRIQLGGDASKTRFAVRNNGNAHLLPTGSVKIRNVITDDVTELPLTPGLLLPGTERKYSVDWNHGNAFGVFKSTATLTAGVSPVRIAVEGDYFVLLPVWSLGVAAFALVALLAGVILIRRRNHTSPVGRHQRS